MIPLITTQPLSARQKAAIIVRVVLGEGEELDLSKLPPDLQTDLAQEMALMGLVDRDTRNAVLSEFCDKLEAVGVSFPGNIDSTLDLLDGHLSADTNDRLRRLAALNGTGDPWERIANFSPLLLAELARTESVEIAAVMFSKLPVPRATEVFGLLDPQRSRQIAYAMSLTSSIEEKALHRIGRALIQAADAVPRPAIEGKAVDKVGAILNGATSTTREEVLTGLDEDDTDFATEVRKTIFAWANIPARVDVRDIPRIIREVEGPTMISAMAGAKGKNKPTVDFLLAGLPTRLAESLREEVETIGTVTSKDAEIAMSNVVMTIRRMEADGDLFLIAQDAESDEQID
ncbi:FliG C-terminal domain-containing protein [Paracoccus aestuariivivens]|uniref:Flagellar motor switch protein FliG n=1 Tax=Paracoccus aestuariivivens TaxID=1820333 RepID=A0A6L6J5C3_9RHOB|nr:FliG C-terminal domain-containing protein [Paracoccus aestuariivivens]MTH77313.1 flagellar motor switch protein FliG [Paracoccus aestuariivivens]